MSEEHPRGVFAALFLVSTAIITLEIVWTRLLAITMYYHFAHMVIGVSMAGLGAAGTLLVTPQLERRSSRSILIWSARLFSLVTLASLPVLVRTTADPLGVLEGFFLRDLVVGLTVCHIFIFLSFLFAGLFICTCISRFRSQVNRLYAVDLLGAAGGCLVAVAGLLVMEGPDVVLVCVSLVAVASVWVARSWRKESALVVPFLALLVVVGSLTRVEVKASRRKEINFFKERYGASVALTRWHPLGHIQVLEEIRSKPYVAGFASPVYGAEAKLRIPQVPVFNDGHVWTPIFRCSGDVKDLNFIPYTLHSFPYQIETGPRVLVIGFGGGIDLYTAEYFGAKQTVGVEMNPVIHRLLLNDYREYTGGVFRRATIETHTAEGRHFVSQLGADDVFDIIQLTAVDTYTALASGAYAVSENYLYTVEGFRAFLEHLTPDGILSFIRQEFSPPRENMRLCTIAAENARRAGGPDPRDHLVIVDSANHTYAIFMFKKSPYSRQEVEAIYNHADRLRFKVVYDPLHRHSTAYGRYLQASDRPHFIESYRYDVSPTTDNRPYFFQFSKLSRLFDWSARPDEFPPRSAPTALLVVIAWSLEILLLAFAFIGVPLWKRVRAAPPRVRIGTVWYFSCLGIGFLTVELVLMQKLTLYLGNPVWAITAVLFALLVFSSAGSFLSRRLRVESRQLGIVLGSIAAFLVAYAFFLGPVTSATLRFGFPQRLFLTFALLAPVGTLMGMPFPSGVRIVGARAPGLIPIAWGANAFASTLGSALSAFLSVTLGFAAVLVGAGLVYGLAWVSLPCLRHPLPKPKDPPQGGNTAGGTGDRQEQSLTTTRAAARPVAGAH